MSAQSRKLLHREILPIVAAGMMLAMPAFAAGNTDQLGTNHKTATKTASAKPSIAQHAVKPLVKQAHKPSATAHNAPAKPHLVVKSSPNVSPAVNYDSQGRVIRRASVAMIDSASPVIDTNLLDDGTFWREDGGQTAWQQTGMASWYGGSRWQGKRTTSGERYDQNQLTAAHATLPLGTKVRVARADGRGSVVVTINDRPGTRTRIIDLSRAAAKQLGILTAGLTMVTLEPL